MSFVLLGLAPSVNAALAPELIVNDAKKRMPDVFAKCQRRTIK